MYTLINSDDQKSNHLTCVSYKITWIIKRETHNKSMEHLRNIVHFCKGDNIGYAQ